MNTRRDPIQVMSLGETYTCGVGLDREASPEAANSLLRVALQVFLPTSLYMYIYDRYIYREREKEMHMYLYIYVSLFEM